MFNCKSKKHWWINKNDAIKCCNGYQRILTFNGGKNQQVAAGIRIGRKWTIVHLEKND